MDAPGPIRSAKLFAEDGIVVTDHSDGVMKTWDLMTGTSKAFSTPTTGILDTHLAGDTLVMVWWIGGEKEYHIWDVYKGQHLRSFSLSMPHLQDLKISGDGSKIFGLGPHGI